MPIVKIRTHRQVTIPKRLFDEAGLREGGFVEVTRNKGRIVINPGASADPDDILTPEEEDLVRKGEAQLRRGESVPWKALKKKLRL